eukprot:CAMPEP_0204276902 /NCGR_PEP_ID=MMETSP0468-20130131/28997_1 /ASSEMBLY_ACC=CAM_ASM_000383 /TAXON_ID=2969 /ORGANISM="Oxyrrhis marina" /LENGTH=91 /DNA_ID=CAMNT_0051253605 /DNA_START=437 /DNA_END=713 /DNA_ORIENTATION=+
MKKTAQPQQAPPEGKSEDLETDDGAEPRQLAHGPANPTTLQHNEVRKLEIRTHVTQCQSKSQHTPMQDGFSEHRRAAAKTTHHKLVGAAAT